MSEKEKIIVPYSLKLTLTAGVFALVGFVVLIISILMAYLSFTLVSVSLFLTAASLIIQNKKVVICGGRIVTKHFLGILKDRSITPVECGFFVAERPSRKTLIYIDKRTLHKNDSVPENKYIYLSENVLSKQEMEGSEYAFGEPILILKYTESTYDILASEFEFNSEPFK